MEIPIPKWEKNGLEKPDKNSTRGNIRDKPSKEG